MKSIRDLAGIGLLAAVLLTHVPAVLAQPAAAAGADERRIILLESKPRAYAVIEQAGGSAEPRVRLAALEATQYAPDAAYALAIDGLVDENPAVRYAALVTIGKLRLNRLDAAALDLLHDENESVRAAAIFAARQCGRGVDLTPLANMLASNNPSARANAAMLIGLLGDPQAAEMLREMAAVPMPRISTSQRAWVRLQFAEAMLRLDPDDAEVLGTVRSAMYSNLDDIRVLAIQVIGEVGDRPSIDWLRGIVERDNPVQVRIAAARALAQMGDTAGAQTLMDGSRYDAETLRQELGEFARANRGSDEAELRAINEILNDVQLQTQVAAEVRAQAAIGLGALGDQASARRLAELLDDPSAVVRVAAASAVLGASR